MTNQFPEYTDDYYFSREKLLRECLPYLDVYSEARELGDRLSALKALEQLNKMFGFYENKLKVEGNVNSNVTINFGFNDDSE